uniref:Uncharacterized protein n=1 Tax=Capra hircus TaxID=9925 RepID=A0A8C2R4A4_CAPHI
MKLETSKFVTNHNCAELSMHLMYQYIDVSIDIAPAFIQFHITLGIKFNMKIRITLLFSFLFPYSEQALVYFYFHKVSQQSYEVDCFIPIFTDEVKSWSRTPNEVIRKRLLIDGDGAGDDRRINLLVKSFIKWCNSGSQEEGYFMLLPFLY